MKNKIFKRLIPIFLIMLVIGAVIPLQVFAKDYEVKYHPANWFGYTHSKEEIDSWIKDAVKYPETSEEAIKALTDKIRPNDVISFQLEVEMPSSDHEEIMQFMKDFQLNMTLPYGVNAMIEVYASDVPLLTDAEYEQKINEFNENIEKLKNKLENKSFLADVEAGIIPHSLYDTYMDMIVNRDKYYNIYLKQLEIAKNRYGIADSSYGTISNWQGKFEDNPNINIEDGSTYEDYREEIFESSNVSPSMSKEEYEKAISEFKEQYLEIKAEYLKEFETAKTEYEQGNISDKDWKTILIGIESINDGTFYDTVMQYFKDCCNGYTIEQSELAQRVLQMAFAGGLDFHNAWLGHYSYKFDDSKVQQNKAITYLFDINIVATDSLSVGNYTSIPVLHWKYEENCPEQRLIKDEGVQAHWEKYYPCNSHRSSALNLGNTYFANDFEYVSSEEMENVKSNDKRYLAFDFINDNTYKSNKMLEVYASYFYKDTLKAVQQFTVEYKDEYGNLIKTETYETDDAYYNVYPEEIYDFKLVAPEYVKGVINNKHTTVIFQYEHKEAEIEVRYLDEKGNELAPNETINGKTLDEYTTVPIDIYGYEPVEIPKNAVGVLHENSSDVEYVYKLKDTLVNAKYLDEKGNELVENEIIKGKVFDNYETIEKEIYGYVLINKPENFIGKMTEENITIDYIYRKIFDKLPDDPYKAIVGDKLSDIELPFGWVFEDVINNPDATVGEVGTKTFNVIVPADDSHPEIRGVVTVEVSEIKTDNSSVEEKPIEEIENDNLRIDKEISNPYTGDTNRIGMFITIAAILIVGITAIILVGKLNKKKNK